MQSTTPVLTLGLDASQVERGNKALDGLKEKASEAGNKVKEFGLKQKTAGAAAGEAAGEIERQGEALQRLSRQAAANEAIAQKLGTSSSNVSFAFKNMGFQIQDVVTQLQMGTDPFRVLIQQGPQITGAFGGLGNTLTAIATKLGPVGLGITAIGAALFGVYKYTAGAEDQMASLNKTLTLTGHYSGLTADAILQLGERAEHAGGSFQGTVDAVQALAKAGVSAGADFGELAKAVQDFSRVSGEPLDDVAKKMAALSNDPVGGLKALQAEYHNITSAQIDHVKQLEEQGNKAEAVAEANNLAARSFKSMAAEINANAGTMERSMHAVMSAAKSMWDAIMDVGRPASSNEKEMQVREQLQTAITRYNVEAKAVAAAGGNATAAQKAALAAAGETIDKLNLQLKTTSANAAAKRDEAAATAEQTAKQQAKNAAEERSNALLEKGKTAAQHRADATKVMLADAKLLGWTQAQIDTAQKAIDEQYKDPKVAKAAAVKVDAGKKMLESTTANLEALKLQNRLEEQAALIGDKTSAQRKDLIKLEQQHAALVQASSTRALTSAEKQTLAVYDQVHAEKEAAAIEGDRHEATMKLNTAHREVSKLIQQQDAEIKSITSSYGMGARAVEQLRKEEELRTKLAQQGASAADIDKEIQKQRELAAAQEHTNATMWQGATAAMTDYFDSMGNSYEQAYTATKDIMGKMSSELTSFFETGKFQARDMFKFILSELIKLGTSEALSKVASLLGGGKTGGGDGLFGSLFKTIGGALFNANGNVFSGGDLSKYSGQIIDKPTLFGFGGLHAFANGAGLMGEAGPEAVMPLKRGANGKLGVAVNGGSTGGIEVNVAVSIDSNGRATSSVASDNKTAAAMGNSLAGVIKAEIIKQTKPGGVLFNRK